MFKNIMNWKLCQLRILSEYIVYSVISVDYHSTGSVKMFKFKRIFICLGIILVLAGCTTTVNLKVKNNTSSQISTKVVLQDENGIRIGNDLSLGVIGVDEETDITFELKPYSSFEVVGSTNAKIATSGQISVLKSPDPFVKEISLTAQAKTLDDSTSLSEISNSFKKLGIDLGASPLPLGIALKTKIGSLIVAERADGNTPGKIYLSIPPNIFGVKELTLEDVPRIPTEEISETEITGGAATSASIEYSTLGSFNTGFRSDGVYKLKWFLSGFGTMQKPEDVNKNPAKMFKMLDKDYIHQIKSTLKRYPKSKVIYVNSFYVLDRARLTIKEAQVADFTTSLDTIVMNAGTAFTFERSQEQHKSYGPVVLNYWGDEFDLIEISNPLINVTTISGEPEITTKDTTLLVPTVEKAFQLNTFEEVSNNL
jgi:hypothetical protein